MKRVLVTGAAGFIASQVCQQLLSQGVEVVGIDNLNDYYDVNLKKWRLAQISNKSFSFIPGDIEERAFIEKIFSQHSFDVIFNLAARAGVRFSMENPFIYMRTNAEGTLNLLEAMKTHGVQKMVLASTSSLYAGLPMPFKEDLPVNTPISPYAASKKAAEALAYSYHHLYDLDISVVRYFTVYGPASRPDMGIYRFAEWIRRDMPIRLFGDGLQARDFTYVEDIARGTIAAAKPLGYEVINLGGGNNPTAINEIISYIEKAMGKSARIEQKESNKADMVATWADIQKAQELLGWKPEISLSSGLDKTIQWHLQEGHKFNI